MPTRIEIYASPEYAADARYLEAALRAAGSALAIAPRFGRLSARPAHLKADWTFWLSAQALPPDWQKDVASNGGQLWLESAGPSVADTAHLAATAPAAAAVAVFRRDAHPLAPGREIVWSDGRGRAILSRQPVGQGSVYQLHTRLNPAWSELADDPQLPAHLLELLRPEPTDNRNQQPRLAEVEAAHDHRALAQAQLFAAASLALPATTRTTPPAFRTTDLRPWLVLLAGLLLLLERLLARRRENLMLPATA